MRIDEPKTPFVPAHESRANSSDATNKSRPVDPQQLNDRLLQLQRETDANGSDNSREEEFLKKRRRHYDEGQRMREAKRLLDEEDDESGEN